MKSLQRDIESYLSRETLVFPSEIAATFWRHEVLRRGSRDAVREDRLISWDTFKERAFDLRQEASPANRSVRTVFAEALIHENAHRPFLAEVIPPPFAGEARGFASAVRDLLPQLPAAQKAMAHPRSNRLRTFAQDLGVIRERYERFLTRHGLFEPGWLDAAGRFLGGAYRLVAPELIDDFPDFRDALAGVPRHDMATDAEPALTIFPDSRLEIRWVLAQVAGLLDSGVDPDEILITVGNLETVADRFRQEGEKYQVPLTIRSGRPLSESSVGRFLRDLGEVVASGFGVEAMERLVLNRALPWKTPAINAELVVRGVANGILASVAGPDPRWRTADHSPDGLHPASVLKTLRSTLPRLVQAGSFSRMQTAFNEMLGRLMDREGWAPSNERILQRAQEELRDLVVMERTLGISASDPYRFWLDRLAEAQYVPQSAGSGVAVLRYRVGAVTYPRHHFVMNASHAATSVVVRPFPFLSDADRAALDDAAASRDLSSAFLNAYAASGDEVIFTAARSTFDGWALPAGLFVLAGRAGEIPVDRLNTMDSSDRYRAERRLANAEGEPTPDGAFPLQESGAASAVAGAPPADGADFTRMPIADPESLELVLNRLSDRDDPALIRLSSTHIDSFRRCPFSYLLTRGLGVEELILDVDPDNPAETGSLYHEILAEFFGDLARTGERFSHADLPRLRERLAAIADATFARARGMVARAALDAGRELFDRIADRLLEHDASLIDGHRPLLAEAWRNEPVHDAGVRLVGRVDRVTLAPDGTVALVDYKKSGLPTVKSVNAGSREAVGIESMTGEEQQGQIQALGTVQIPLYVRLLEANGFHVSTAGYYSLEKATYRSIVDEAGRVRGKPGMTRERLEEVMGLMDIIVGDIAEKIRGGDFACEHGCDGCEMRSVCRTRYHVR